MFKSVVCFILLPNFTKQTIKVIIFYSKTLLSGASKDSKLQNEYKLLHIYKLLTHLKFRAMKCQHKYVVFSLKICPTATKINHELLYFRCTSFSFEVGVKMFAICKGFSKIII